ncbi:GlsB/YeaQ/YmgE family stress response membrane protein [Pyxidicoccus parkwayensis]|uniref:GlsB/YeaQ/YmgE family stress response membrane protein n=1 Tax=Pyxidicoccus parkwayensis TaxID=2813578 RepID=A0ABX7P1A2_9BACT|nr:GlsB/YeaQ/YmgE family stress response membrane protein [Pyxidicoccus parkwaysis]QSQ23584.1 GlsB/YeaQ/YmgE family stress response membrane protein [Pyxidicoccus parkwaysis]
MAPVKSSRALPFWLTLLLLAGTAPAWGQEASGEEPAQAPAPELTPPPLIPASGTDQPLRGRPPAEGENPRGAASHDEASTTALSEPALPGRADARKEDPVPRVAVELVGGTAGGIVAGTVGLVAGYVLALPTVGCDDCRVVSLVGGFAGVLIGIPAGTWTGGRVMGGRGTLLATTGGSLVGWGGALLGALLLDSGDSDALSLALLVMPIVGATAGYELSQSSTPAAPPARLSRQSQVHVVPLAGMTEHGPRLGLMGRF